MHYLSNTCIHTIYLWQIKIKVKKLLRTKNKQYSKRIYISNHFEILFAIFDFIKLHLYISFLNAAKKKKETQKTQKDKNKTKQTPNLSKSSTLTFV